MILFSLLTAAMGAGAQPASGGDAGQMHEAFVAISHHHFEEAEPSFWPSLSGPSLWEPPGYSCESVRNYPTPSGVDL